MHQRENLMDYMGCIATLSPGPSKWWHQQTPGPSCLQKVENNINQIIHYPAETQRILLILIHWIVIYLLDSAIHLLNNWGLDIRLPKCTKNHGVFCCLKRDEPFHSARTVAPGCKKISMAVSCWI